MSTLKVASRTIFQASFTDQDGDAVDITGATITMRYKIAGGSIVERTATITDASNGIAQYEAVADELTAGMMQREWKVLTAAGKIHTAAEIFHSDIEAVLA